MGKLKVILAWMLVGAILALAIWYASGHVWFAFG